METDFKQVILHIAIYVLGLFGTEFDTFSEAAKLEVRKKMSANFRSVKFREPLELNFVE